MTFTNKDLKNMIIPLFFEQLFVMLVGIIDTFIVSFVGESAVSGVSLVNSFNTIFIYLFTALASGGAVVISQYIFCFVFVVFLLVFSTCIWLVSCHQTRYLTLRTSIH